MAHHWSADPQVSYVATYVYGSNKYAVIELNYYIALSYVAIVLVATLDNLQSVCIMVSHMHISTCTHTVAIAILHSKSLKQIKVFRLGVVITKSKSKLLYYLLLLKVNRLIHTPYWNFYPCMIQGHSLFQPCYLQDCKHFVQLHIDIIWVLHLRGSVADQAIVISWQ